MKKSIVQRLVVACALACTYALLTVSVLPAQRLGPAPKRPKVPSALDTNDARAYHDWAMEVFERDPGNAASAFYWAARIDPTLASALYGRRAALIMNNNKLRSAYMSGRRRGSDNKEMRALDSLYLRALMIDPFLHTGLDKRMLMQYLTDNAVQESRRSGEQMSPQEIQFYLTTYLRQTDADTRAWVAYSDGQFARAIQFYAEAIRNSKEKAYLRIDRGRTFAMIGNTDSAVYEFSQALDELRKNDAKSPISLYNSKAVLEHSIAAMYERDRKIPQAKEAYGKALQEDLSYYPAHMRLGLLAVDGNDTTTALSELELAAQIATDEPFVHVTYGFALLRFGKTDEAIVELNKSVALEPLYARPHALLLDAFEKKGDKASAVSEADKFLALASDRDPDRAAITQRRAALAK